MLVGKKWSTGNAPKVDHFSSVLREEKKARYLIGKRCTVTAEWFSPEWSGKSFGGGRVKCIPEMARSGARAEGGTEGKTQKKSVTDWDTTWMMYGVYQARMTGPNLSQGDEYA